MRRFRLADGTDHPHRWACELARHWELPHRREENGLTVEAWAAGPWTVHWRPNQEGVWLAIQSLEPVKAMSQFEDLREQVTAALEAIDGVLGAFDPDVEDFGAERGRHAIVLLERDLLRLWRRQRLLMPKRIASRPRASGDETRESVKSELFKLRRRDGIAQRGDVAKIAKKLNIAPTTVSRALKATKLR